MTDRLYYTDPYLREFDATVVGVESRDGVTRVTLDRTGFYPASGGQPFDTGVLAGAAVVDVVDEESGAITHVVDGGVFAEGHAVHGAIDWPRRYDHMQQHTGQHVLSAAFDRLVGARTVGFHLGAAGATIDLAREVTPREIAAAEDEANRIVTANLPVTIRFATAGDAADLQLRKKLQEGSKALRTGTVRLIDIEGFDLSACGGTHVSRTGGIGAIVTTSAERFRGGQRIEFLCGGRALGRFRMMRDTLAASTRLLSVTPEELPGAIERLQADARHQTRTLSALQAELSKHRAAEMAGAAVATPRGRLVLQAVDADANGLKAIATAITTSAGYVVALVSASTPALTVVARSAGVDVAANTVIAALLARFGGRGGGRPELAQAGGLTGPAEEILAAARQLILG